MLSAYPGQARVFRETGERAALQAVFVQPQIERGHLPQLGAAQRCQLAMRIRQQAVEHGRVEEAAILSKRTVRTIIYMTARSVSQQSAT